MHARPNGIGGIPFDGLERVSGLVFSNRNGSERRFSWRRNHWTGPGWSLIGRLAGYGLGLMFMAGYALQLSHLTLMVVLGLMLLNIDKRGSLGRLRNKNHDGLLYQPIRPVYGQQTP